MCRADTYSPPPPPPVTTPDTAPSLQTTGEQFFRGADGLPCLQAPRGAARAAGVEEVRALYGPALTDARS